MEAMEKYAHLTDKELTEKIIEIKKKLGKRLVILTHHYQRQEVVDLGDFRGDSYGLSVSASRQQDAEFIVFCGVHFMAEAASILARKDQRVFHPDFDAGCPMAKMAHIEEVERAFNELAGVIDITKVVPLTYMNSDALLKAFCGARGGAVVTSSNAPEGFKWAFERGEKIFFFPDEHLGRNTADKLSIPQEQLALWNPQKELGGNTAEVIKKSKVFVWKGYCHVHTWFKVEHIEKVRREHPDAKIVVHPECPREVVQLADANGSTEFIIRYVQQAPSGSVIAVGTEINLVARLARQHKDKTVFELSRSLCPNMYKINLRNLCYTLENLPYYNEVKVGEVVRADALLALKRMLEIRGTTARAD